LETSHLKYCLLLATDEYSSVNLKHRKTTFQRRRKISSI